MPRRELIHSSTGFPVHMAFTDAADGDFAVDSDEGALRMRRDRLAPHPWTWLNQVHGPRVVEVDAPGEWAGAEADAAVSSTVGAVLAVHTADCGGVLLVGSGADPVTAEPVTVIGAAHAGWKGLRDGILQHAVDAMRRLGAEQFRWDLGPCISPAAYEFSPQDLDVMVELYGPAVRSRTLQGAPALDLRQCVRAALAATGVEPGAGPALVPCTALDPGFYSWRARADTFRHAAAIWIGPDDLGEESSE